MKRHAYCIIAHNDAYCLEKLISLIDDERNDIILIFDKKSDLSNSFLPQTRFSRILRPQSSQLIDIQWGGVSLMKAEMLAMSIAVEAGKYDYIHLISGVDLPLKSQDYIHNFFNRLKPGTNCMSFINEEYKLDAFNANCRYYHLFTNYARCKNIFVRKFCSLMRKSFIRLQQGFGYERNWSGWTFGKGTNWVSITYDFANYLVKNKETIIKRFRGVHCSDEIWKHTMLLSSSYKDTVANFEGLSNCVRRIDWNRGNPYTWRLEDYDELAECNELFARKFNSCQDTSLINKIYDYVKQQS